MPSYNSKNVLRNQGRSSPVIFRPLGLPGEQASSFSASLFCLRQKPCPFGLRTFWKWPGIRSHL